ncbi:ATP-binding cassette sub-family A member 17-like isoform X4 [Tamandua tetradactyla]|uniref:ATP-binding cassette sub-family A member 17-like isoform X4 n=1 Tax=Tamandua tetradactyla TaxID=48850 RepID=UPI0040549E0B
MTVFRNLKLLLWKNFILKKRKTLITVLEILMPLLFSTIVMYLRFNSLPRMKPPVNYSAIDISLLPDFFYHFPLKSKFQLVYIPSKSETLKALTEMVEKSFDVDFEVLGSHSLPSFNSYVIKDPKSFYVLAGIFFDHSFKDSKEPLPLSVKYHLCFSYIKRNYLLSRLIFFRDDGEGWSTSYLYPPNPGQEPREYLFTDGGHPGYYREGFLAIQHAMDKAIMWHHAHDAMTQMFKNITVLVKRFPCGAYVQDSFFLVLQSEFPLLLMLSFICIELIIINSIALEKERKLKDYMCMMGLHNWLHWVAWFVMFFLSVLIAVSFMTMLFCTEVNNVAVFTNSDPGLIFLFLMCFAIATIFFAFMTSTFFRKAHVATAAGGVIFFFTFLPYLYITFSYAWSSQGQKIASCLFSNVAMALGVRLISIFEAKALESILLCMSSGGLEDKVKGKVLWLAHTGVGIQWRNIGSINGDFNFTQVLLMLLLDSFLYGLVAWYVESISPGEYGVSKPWYFFVMPSYWNGEPRRTLSYPMLDPEESLKSEFIQDEPSDLMKGIEIQHLYKVFHIGRSKHIAVKNLTMNLYRGQITVLLGHNGAGKTTTCSVLTGLRPPSSGQVYINGYEISQDMVKIRKSLGWCPQHDILFDNLTVAEHLYFYARLKGLPHQKCPEEVQQMLRVLNLEDKQNSRSRFLSGGMRRKLSIGIALIAGSKVLMLDEPTSGMDAISRRAIWDLLQQQKGDRTILLTTHFMDEADLLGDRIAIMAKGELQCCGSSLFLKKKYGAGYYMTLVKESHCNIEKISHLIYDHIPDAVLEDDTGEEVTFVLPKENVHRVNKLVDSSTDLQTVKLPSLHSHSLVDRVPVDRIKRFHSRIFSVQTGLPIKPNTGFSLLCQQFYAMFLKRVTYSWRNWMLILSLQILVPLVIIIFNLTAFNLTAKSVESAPLELTLRQHGQSIVPFFVSQNSRLGPQLSAHFINMVVNDGQIPLEVVGSLDDFLLKKAEEEPESFDAQYIVAVTFEDVKNHTIVTALFNNQAYHSPALALTLVDNFLLKLLSGADASITVWNHPQPLSSQDTSESISYQGPKGHYLVINLLFGMAFLSSSFSILTVKERSTKVKHIQFVSGVSVATFWLSALLWDLISFLIPNLLLLVVFLYYREEAFIQDENLAAVFLILMLYGWAIIPFIYLVSFCFGNPGSACVKLVVMLTFLSIGPIILVSVTSEKDLGYTAISESLDDTFLVLPGHCLGMAFSNLYYNFELKKFCNANSLNETACNEVSEGYVIQKDIYAWKSLGVGKYLTALAVLGPVYLILLFLIETNALWRLKAKISDFCRKMTLVALLDTTLAPEDQDVAMEKKTIQSNLRKLCENNPLVIKEMSKVYFKKTPLLAVKQISFLVRAEECFGLLGPNGAGKTSIFKMLTGEEHMTSGNAFVSGLSIRYDIKEVQRRIGYCPQFDALLDHMTGQEMLVMYARLRGVPERHIGTCVEQMIDDLSLCPYAGKLVKTYSGGNKRKLSTGIALIGDPAVIFLDEPSTGMDPVARRLLWGTVARVRKSGKAIVITSHSMEECEALCTRLAIMVQGQFKCLGSPQHLKSKFGSGYSLRAKVRNDRQKEALEKFKAFVNLTFPGCVLEDEHQGMVHYHLPSYGLSWAKVFGTLERAKEEYSLDDYSVSQITLEDIFLSLNSPTALSRGAS